MDMIMQQEEVLFTKNVEGLGEIQLRSFDLKKDTKMIYDWVTRPYAKYWGMQEHGIDQVAKEYEEIVGHTSHHACMGILNGTPIFLMEYYDPSNDVVGAYYPVIEGDVGMHILVAPVEQKISNFTWNVFTTVMDFLFSKSTTKRIVVEPDIENNKIHVLNTKAGFQYLKTIQLPHKKAGLAVCTRQDYKNAITKNRTMNTTSNTSVLAEQIDHLSPEIWTIVNRNLIRKAISEFAHELILDLEIIGKEGPWTIYKLNTDSPEIAYFFKAQKRALDHLHIDLLSITKTREGKEVELNALDFILELKDTLQIPDAMLPTYMEEITSTLFGAAYKYAHQKFDSVALTEADFQQVEKAMTEGHPCFVANNGRIGFNNSQYHHFAPEVSTTFSLVWIAAHKAKADFHGTALYPYETLIENELGADLLQTFNQKLSKKGLDTQDYIFMPVHPWQWENKISTTFAQDIAQKFIVLLGEGTDQYAAQQSIRTLFNTTNPKKLYTKTALSILNMGFMRGLSPYYMGSTPVITEWISDLLENDDFLRETGFTMLGEIATVGYRNRYYETLGKTKPHNKMLSALWRESPYLKINKNQRLITMAALLHLDNNGQSLVVETIKKSGVSVAIWLERYLNAYLTPLLHCLYQYELVFMPHGENLILVLEDNIPVKAIMKDITEEIAIFDHTIDLPEKAKRLYVEADDEIKALAIFTDVFDCFFRFLSNILVQSGGYDEAIFWKKVAECVLKYQAANPQLSEKFKQIDLFVPEFKRCCLNRLQLKNTKHMLDLADPVESLQFKGTITNPIAIYKVNSELKIESNHE